MRPHTMPGGGGKAMRRFRPSTNHSAAPAISISSAALAVRNLRLRITASNAACTASQTTASGNRVDFSPGFSSRNP